MLSLTNRLLQYIFQGLEKSPKRTFRASELKRISSADFDRLLKEKLLKYYRYEPKGDLYPCASGCSSCDSGFMRTVAKIGKKWEAVCQDGEADAETIPLAENDITKYAFDINSFAEIIRNDNNLSGNYEELDDRLYFVGAKEIDKQPVAFVLALLSNPKNAEPLLLTLPYKLSRYQAMVILSPFFNLVSQGTLKTLESSHIYFYDFTKVFTGSNWIINPQVLSSIAAKLTSQAEILAKFPTPDGTNWDNTTIEFITEDGVKINMPGFQHPYTKHFSVMGFQDTRRTSQGIVPDKAWRVFRLIAQNQGEWTLGDLLKKAKVFRKKKDFDPALAELSAAGQKEEYLKQFTGITIAGMKVSDIPTYVGMLRKRLKEYFGINDDPFYPYHARGKKPGYQAKFRVFCSYRESELDENSPL